MAAMIGAKAWLLGFLAAFVAMVYREGRESAGSPGELQAPPFDADEAADEEAFALFQSRLHQAGALNALEPTPALAEQPADGANSSDGIATGPWGFDVSGMMDSVEPGRDFYGYANGNWLNRTVIPADRSAWNQYAALNERAKLQVRGLLEQGAKEGTETGLLYKSFMDEELVERLGVTPLQPTLDRVRQIADHQQFAAFAGAAKFGFGAAPFSLSVGADSKDPEKQVLLLGQAGIDLPREYYLQPRFAEVKAAYKKRVATMLGLAGWPNPDLAAADVLAFEDSLAQVFWDGERTRDQVANYNKMTVADLPAHLPGFHWEAFLQAAGGVPPNAIVIVSALNQTARDGIIGIVDVVNATNISTLKSWEAWNVIQGAARLLPKAFADADLEFGRVAQGVAQNSPRWKRGLDLVNQVMKDPLDKQYVEKFFPDAARTAANEFVGLLKQAFEQHVRALTWMSDATKQKALEKLAALTFEIGYPEKFRDYAGAPLNGSDLYGNVEKGIANTWNISLGTLGRPTEHGYWADSTTQLANAYYKPTENKFVIQAAILQPPFYNSLGDMAVNFGGIGAIIGHEITHGFDDQGRTRDGQGRLEDWWTPDDAAEFDRRARAFGEQYGNFSTGIPAGMHIRPGLTMGENLADLGGLAVAYDALKLWLRNHTYEAQPPLLAPDSDGHEIDRRFFLGWAQVWREKNTAGELERILTTDSHPPGFARVGIPLRNIDAWYSAFNVKPGDPLYLDKAERVQIW